MAASGLDAGRAWRNPLLAPVSVREHRHADNGIRHYSPALVGQRERRRVRRRRLVCVLGCPFGAGGLTANLARGASAMDEGSASGRIAIGEKKNADNPPVGHAARESGGAWNRVR